MALIDGNLVFGQDVSMKVGGPIGDAIDLAAYHASAARDAISSGYPLWWVNLITETAAGGSNVTFKLVTHGHEEISGVGNQKLVISPTFPMAELTEGMYWNVQVPVTSIGMRRYLGMTITVTGGILTALSLTSYLTTSPPAHGWKALGGWRQ